MAEGRSAGAEGSFPPGGERLPVDSADRRYCRSRNTLPSPCDKCVRAVELKGAAAEGAVRNSKSGARPPAPLERPVPCSAEEPDWAPSCTGSAPVLPD